MNKTLKKILVFVVAFALLGYAIYLTNKRYNTTNSYQIGVIIPLTGPQANYGKYIQHSLELARDQINSRNPKKQFSLIFEDDKADAGTGQTVMRKLISEDHVKVVFGPWASSSAIMAAKVAENNKVIMMAEAIAPQLKTAGDYIFRIQPDATIYIDKLADYISTQTSFKKIAIFYVNNDFGKTQAYYLKYKLEMTGRTVVYNDAFEPNSTDFRTALLKIKQTAPDAIFCPAYAEISNIMIQLKELGIRTQVFGSVPTENPAVIASARGAADGVIYPHHFNPNSTNPKFIKFIQDYKAKYGNAPEGFASLAYDGLYILCDAISNSKSYDPDLIKDQLYHTQNYQGINGSISFDKNGDVIMPIIIKQVEGGKFNVIWK